MRTVVKKEVTAYSPEQRLTRILSPQLVLSDPFIIYQVIPPAHCVHITSDYAYKHRPNEVGHCRFGQPWHGA